MRSTLKSVSEEKISAAFRECPVAEYTTNASTLASAGREMATALFAERIISRERMYLDGTVSKWAPSCWTKRDSNTYDISLPRSSSIRSKYGFSQAKYLMIFMPPSNSCRSFARLSVQIMDFARILMKRFMTSV